LKIAVARESIDIAPVANVSHDSSLFGRNNVRIPIAAAAHAKG
jgi:hypothetical protein